MRRSLPLRLLGLALVVAAFAIAATSWLITRDTSERFRGEFERTLEADTFIYQQLHIYGSANETWDDVDGLVAELAQRTGRRVALTTLDGDPLSDSLVLAGRGGPLPSAPTAEIDPLPIVSGETTFVAYGGDSVYADTRSHPSFDAGTSPTSMFPGDIGFTRPGVSPTWRMSEDEAATRYALAKEAQRCLQDDLDTDARVIVSPGGEVLLVDSVYLDEIEDGLRLGDASGTVLTAGAGEVSLHVLPGEPHPCLPDELLRPSAAAVEFNTVESELLQRCLDDAAIEYVTHRADTGLIQTIAAQVIGESDAPHGASRQEAIEFTWAQCSDAAGRDAMKEFLAEPALLYTGVADRFDPLFGDGWWRTAAAGVAVLALATLITAVAGRRMTRPIHALTGAARRMGAGDTSARVKVTGSDEFAQLGAAFNSMAESIEASDTQRKAMVSDVAHELRTPLANVRGYLEAAQDGVVPTDPDLIASLLEEAALLERLVSDLQDLALADAGTLRIHPEPRLAADLLRQVAAAHGAAAKDAGVALVVTVLDERSSSVNVDPERLRQALGNLVGNAIRFTPDGGTVTLTVSREDSTVAFAVRDDGPGIPSEHLPRLFDRFYRVEGSRSRETGGSGLGLAITKHLVTAHGGTIDVDSVVGAGSVFTIRLPAYDPDGEL